MHSSPLSSSTSQCSLQKNWLKHFNQKVVNWHRGCCSSDTKSHVRVNSYHDTIQRKLIYVCFLMRIFLSDATCPSPYSYVPGDVSGPGSLDYETHSMDNMTRWRGWFPKILNWHILFRCAELCNEKTACQSFEFSLQNAACSFNLEVCSSWLFCLFIQIGGGSW